MKKKMVGLMLALGMTTSVLTGCSSSSTSVTSQISTASAETAAEITEDRAGNSITLPDKVEKIVSMAPSTTRVLIDLGVSDKIVGIDTNSASYADDLPADVEQFDMMSPDNEAITALDPDIVFTSGMSNAGGNDVFQALRDAGICVADIPSSTSFEGIEEDIQFIGDCIGESSGAEKITDTMKSDLKELEKAGKTISDDDKKIVLFEISIPTADYPTIYTTGSGTYIDEMITTIGAENICADQDGWISISEEDAIAMNPDVIITDVNYVDDPVNMILSAEGWKNVTAIVNKDVYYVDVDTANQPNQHVVDAVISIGKDIYPDAFSGWDDPLAELNAAYNTAK